MGHMLETACRSPGGQPRKVALAGLPCQKNVPQKVFLPRTLADCALPKKRQQGFFAGKRHRQIAFAGKNSGELSAGKKRQG